MRISKRSLEVFEDEAHIVEVDGEEKEEHYSFVIFYQEEHVYRHNKTFDTFKEAYAFMLKIWGSADAHGVIEINEQHWGVFEREIAC